MFKRSSRVLLVTLLLFVLAGATYAFAAANTVPDTYAGDGEGGISGYTVSNITYTTSGSDVTGVSFSLSANATDVQAAIGDTYPGVTNTLYDCTGSDQSWSCTFPAGYVTINDAVGLRVIAVQ